MRQRDLIYKYNLKFYDYRNALYIKEPKNQWKGLFESVHWLLIGSTLGKHSISTYFMNVDGKVANVLNRLEVHV